MDNRFTLADRRKVRLRVDELTEREESTRIAAPAVGLLPPGLVIDGTAYYAGRTVPHATAFYAGK